MTFDAKITLVYFIQSQYQRALLNRKQPYVITVVNQNQLVHPESNWGLCCLLTMFKIHEHYVNN